MKYNFRFFAFVVCLSWAGSSWAQTPEAVTLLYSSALTSPAAKSLTVACADQDAGTATQTLSPTAQSNDVTFLCLNDILIIDHAADGDLTGDPQPLTQPGFGYAFYTCPPSITGPDLAAILSDPCLAIIPPAPNGVWVTTGTDPNGDTQFTNNGALQTFFNSGDPLLLYFAPITIDAFASNGFEQAGGGPPGPCVNANVADAFPVVYLNAINASGITYQTGVLGGSFSLNGGLPEYDGSNYNITITLSTNPAVTGTITSGTPTFGSTVTFTVPQAGIYNIVIEDGKSCGATLQATLPAVAVSISDEIVASGGNACADISVVNFTGMSNFNFIIDYNSTLLDYTGSANLNLTGLTGANITETVPGSISVNWASVGPGITVPNNTVIFQLCFNALGANGSLAPLGFTNTPIFNNTTGPVGVVPQSGSVSIATGGFGIIVTADSISCGETPALSDGSISITTVGGAAPFSYSWAGTTNALGGSGIINTTGGTANIPNLPTGTYAITVTTAFGQSQTATIEVATASPLFASLTANNPTCSTLSDGSINLGSLGGGVGPYDINWNVPGFDGLLTLTNLAQGNYVVTVTDSRGCSRVAASSIGVNPILVTGSNVTEATCEGINNGNINILGVGGGTTGGTGNYNFTWSTSDTDFGPSTTLSSLAPGVYTVTITDSNACTNSATFTVTPDKIVSINASITNPACFQQPSGFITAVGVTVGAPPATPYIFTWSANAGTPIVTPTQTLASSLLSGTYNLTVTDQNGCTTDTVFTLTQPTELIINTTSQTNESCTTGGDGTLNITNVSGGTSATGVYNYIWSNTLTTAGLTGLSAGVYTVTVSDDSGCNTTQSFTILPPQPPTITGFDVSAPTCSNTLDGVVSVLVTPGAAAITNYNWVSNLGPVPQIGATLTGLTGGTYTVTVTDGDGCTISSSTLVVAPDPLFLADTTLILPSCPGFTNGSIVLNVTGGTPNLVYTLVGGSGPQGGAVFPGLDAGLYTFSVTDENDCPAYVFSITLPDPPALQVVFSNIDSVSCGSQTTGCDGTATALASGGSANTGSYTFTWQSLESSVGTQSTASQLCAGEQLLVISDGVCGDSFFVNIPAPAAITASVNTTQATCFGFCDGTISVAPQGGTPPYLLTWSTGITANPQVNLCAGPYNVIITDSKACNYVVVTAVDQPDSLVAVADPSASNGMSCYGLADGQITVIYGGGNAGLGNFTFSWNPPVGSTESVSNLGPGLYTCTVTDPLGCLDTAQYLVTQPDPIVAIIQEPDLPQCFGFQTTVTVDTAFGGNGGPFLFRVDFGPEYDLGDAAPIYAGDHTISVVDLGQGLECVLDSVISVIEPPEITVDLGPDLTVELGASFTFDPIITSAFPLDFDSIMWTPQTYLTETSDPRRPITTPTAPITYNLTVFDLNGCSGTDNIFIDVDRNRNVFIPNIFSPNGDDFNDFFGINMGIGVAQANYFRVFDRWGNLVFEANNIQPGDIVTGWDGTHRGTLLSPAVFTYISEVRFIDNVTLIFKGDVTLIR